MKKKFSRKRGFALVELLVVVAVIALLMSILLPSLPAVKDQDKIAECLANMRSLMQSTNIYLLDHDDNFPMYPKSHGGTIGICGWSYGGKTNDSYWMRMPYFYHEFDQRPMNGWILTNDPEPDLRDPSGTIIKRAEVPSLRCPADRTSYQRLWGTPGAQPDPISCYDDVGTSYLYNFVVYLGPTIDVIKDGMTLGQTQQWLWYQGGWVIINRDLIRDVRLSCPAEFVLFYEDPMDWGLGNYPKRRVMGNHGFSKHTAGFLDGHASFEFRDTRSFCGPSWFALNPSWIKYPSQPTGPYYYSNYNIRNCDPLPAIGPGDTGQ